MNGPPAPVTTPSVDIAHGRRSRSRWVIGAVVLVLLAAAGVAARSSLVDGDRRAAGSSGGRSATDMASVTRQTLSQTTQFNGLLGYAGSYSVLGRAPGTVTWLPRLGQVVHQGQVLYQVDGAPVVLLYGATPAYRTLAVGGSAAAATGHDVRQLNHDLVALGFAHAAQVGRPWDEFSWGTRAGVLRLQHHLGVDQTGKLELGDVVFLPSAARVTAHQATIGGPAAGPVLRASSTARTVTVALDPSLQAGVRRDDPVVVTLPDGTVTPGRVTSVGTVATVASSGPRDSSGTGGSGGSGSGPTVPVQITLIHPAAAGRLDQALVEVAITGQTVHDALAVPVTALVARAGGGYAVEVVGSDATHHLVSVQPGLFDDAAGLVQVSGPGLVAGQHVVVPGDA
jgi:hypothetical protein